MNASPASFNIMILITDGEHDYEYFGGDPAATAAEIRADGRTTIFAVGVDESLFGGESECYRLSQKASCFFKFEPRFHYWFNV